MGVQRREKNLTVIPFLPLTFSCAKSEFRLTESVYSLALKY